MDLNWIKELADKANQVEQERQEQLRKQSEKARQLALATAPFIEKLHKVISTCAEEFNKHVQTNQGKVLAGRMQKRTKRTVNEGAVSYPEESTYFAFSRKDWTFGIRGSAGVVEFVEISSTGEPLSVRLDELGATPSHKLEAYLDEAKQQVGWQEEGSKRDGQAIMLLCQNYFKEFIERTN